ncbi:hypothetical protein [Bdellovibrio sp. HCB337]|uniref:hypothetical protein n=1 Tax=Bdellovibrio sp. HCB337 TaxID=3394358 RepID=UPI0039A715DA
MRFFAPALLLITPLMSLANPQFETLKTLDGAVLYCNSSEHVGNEGFILEDTAVSVSNKSADALDFSFGPNFYKCAKGANGYEWAPSDIQEFLTDKVKTEQGTVRIVPTSYKWVVYSENYTELNPEPSITKAGHANYTVKVSDLLSSEGKSRRRSGKSARGIVTVFLKYTKKAIYPNGEEMNLGQYASGSFNIVITLPSN